MLRSDSRGAVAAHEIVSLARERMADGHSVHFAPEIPPRKEAGARRIHALHLPENEPIVALYDHTLLGSGEEGFVLTAARLCWKNFLEHARQIAWEELDPASIAVVPNGGVSVAGGKVLVGESIAPGAAATLYELAARFGRAKADPYRAHAEASPGASEGSIPVARLIALARRLVGEVDALYYHPGIPPPKLRNARATHAAHLPAEEEVAVLYDDTLFGSGADGFVITPERLCWRNFTSDAETQTWAEIAPDTITIEVAHVRIGDRSIQLTGQEALVAPVAALFAAIAAAARGARCLAGGG